MAEDQIVHVSRPSTPGTLNTLAATPTLLGLPTETRQEILRYLLHSDSELIDEPKILERRRDGKWEIDCLTCGGVTYRADTLCDICSRAGCETCSQNEPCSCTFTPSSRSQDAAIQSRIHSMWSSSKRYQLHPQILQTCRRLHSDGKDLLFVNKIVNVLFYITVLAEDDSDEEHMLYVLGEDSLTKARQKYPGSRYGQRLDCRLLFDNDQRPILGGRPYRISRPEAEYRSHLKRWMIDTHLLRQATIWQSLPCLRSLNIDLEDIGRATDLRGFDKFILNPCPALRVKRCQVNSQIQECQALATVVQSMITGDSPAFDVSALEMKFRLVVDLVLLSVYDHAWRDLRCDPTSWRARNRVSRNSQQRLSVTRLPVFTADLRDEINYMLRR